MGINSQLSHIPCNRVDLSLDQGQTIYCLYLFTCKYMDIVSCYTLVNVSLETGTHIILQQLNNIKYLNHQNILTKYNIVNKRLQGQRVLFLSIKHFMSLQVLFFLLLKNLVSDSPWISRGRWMD